MIQSRVSEDTSIVFRSWPTGNDICEAMLMIHKSLRGSKMKSFSIEIVLWACVGAIMGIWVPSIASVLGGDPTFSQILPQHHQKLFEWNLYVLVEQLVNQSTTYLIANNTSCSFCHTKNVSSCSVFCIGGKTPKCNGYTLFDT